MNNIIKTFATMSVLLLSSHCLNAQIHFGSQSNNNSNTVNASNVSSAIGTNNTSTGQCSFAGGNNSTASGLNSFAFGSQASSTGANSVAIGFCATSSGVISYSFGKHVASNQNSAMTIGFGQKDHPLVNNVSGSIAMGVGSNIPTFLITDSHFVGKTGKVAIGNCTVPQSKLHIKADNDEDADITLEPGQNKDASIMFRNKESFIKVEKSGKMTIAVPNKPIFFNASKYYINSNNTYIENKEDIDFNVKAPKNINVDAEQLRITSKVGINMENTHEGLDVAIAKGVYAPNGFMLSCNNETERKPIMLEGCVNINTGTPYTDEWFSLAVKGGILAEQVLIKSERSWPDFVFASDYELMPLSELKSYIETNRHLPDVPSESQVNEQGVEVGEMQSVLLKKIEELTLYTIQLQEQVEQLQQKVNELETK